MNDAHNEAEKKIIADTLDFYTRKLIADTVALIHQTERDANKRLNENNIHFDLFSPANVDYLTAALHDALFDRLHKGDIELAKLILTMNGKRVGVCHDR
ncbi:hypothetical protein [Pantoea sp. C2G6]|uniref:hypothetical protein n=1 Tax=Pantoea sp. C2G6 TaxID=3243084 RepID=UPI003EDB0ACD